MSREKAKGHFSVAKIGKQKVQRKFFFCVCVCGQQQSSSQSGIRGKENIIWLNRWCPCSRASPPESRWVRREDPSVSPGGFSGLIPRRGWGLPPQAATQGGHQPPATSPDGFSSPLIEVCNSSALLINMVSISRLRNSSRSEGHYLNIIKERELSQRARELGVDPLSFSHSV